VNIINIKININITQIILLKSEMTKISLFEKEIAKNLFSIKLGQMIQ
jgi:hypothetical protein